MEVMFYGYPNSFQFKAAQWRDGLKAAQSCETGGCKAGMRNGGVGRAVPGTWADMFEQAVISPQWPARARNETLPARPSPIESSQASPQFGGQ
jgi:hypothetical protein